MLLVRSIRLKKEDFMKKFGVMEHKKTKKVTTIGRSHMSRRKHGKKNHQKKYPVDSRGQG